MTSLSIDFDDLAPGMEVETEARTVTESDVIAFADLTGDRNPQHLDAGFARESIFGERIAHGMLVLSCAVGLLPLDPHRVVALRRIADATFKAPVKLGDTIRVHTRVVEVRPLEEGYGIVTLRWKVVNQKGATALRAKAEVLWRRTPPS
ncbi:MAG: MaoC family dehydratase N-terminal domain-containing protein [Actinomycetota bacterium]|nr:MaoC family dehydratase N-terminal domain-containing protein [Actinomycetota bacterium]